VERTLLREGTTLVGLRKAEKSSKINRVLSMYIFTGVYSLHCSERLVPHSFK
jgi:hypothetical protein